MNAKWILTIFEVWRCQSVSWSSAASTGCALGSQRRRNPSSVEYSE
jgi:hypothetical protein